MKDGMEQKLVSLMEKVSSAFGENVPKLTSEYIQYIATEAYIDILLVWTGITVGFVTSVFAFILGWKAHRDGRDADMVFVGIFLLLLCFLLAATFLAPNYVQYLEPAGYAVDKALNG